MSCAVNRFQVQYFVAVVKTRTRASDGSHEQQQHTANPAALQSPHDDSVTTQTPPVICSADDACCGDGGGGGLALRYDTIRYEML